MIEVCAFSSTKFRQGLDNQISENIQLWFRSYTACWKPSRLQNIMETKASWEMIIDHEITVAHSEATSCCTMRLRLSSAFDLETLSRSSEIAHIRVVPH